MSSIPNHVAIIPDGNRRWAKAHNLNPWDGHTEGVKRYWEISEYANDQGINHLTIWGASYDNLKKRSKLEVTFLLKLMETEVFKPELLERCLRDNVRARIFGEWREFITNKKVLETVIKLEDETKHFTDKSLNILFAYDGRKEMIAAANTLVQDGQIVTGESLRGALWTAALPDVDLVIRTGGEPHWSAGFMMWLTASSQFYFTEGLWPDFTNAELKKALVDYERRERRLGK